LHLRLTAGVTGAGAGVDSAWEQEKLEARKMLENAAESPASSARFVGRTSFCRTEYSLQSNFIGLTDFNQEPTKELFYWN